VLRAVFCLVLLAAGSALAEEPKDVTRPSQAPGRGPVQYFRIGSPLEDPAFLPPEPASARPSYGLAAVEVFTLDFGLWMTDRFRAASYSDVGWDTWVASFRKGWIVDTDDFWMNGALHPLTGAYSFTAARSLGIGFKGAFGYALVSSLAWEQFAENQAPSISDELLTPPAAR
jgi:hypothetical protein